MRALNRSYGPGRFLTISFAILRHIPKTWTNDEDVEFDTYPGYASFEGRAADVGNDGDLYYLNQLDWFALKGDKVRPGQTFVFYARHNFTGKDTPWKAGEHVYYAADRKANYYPLDDSRHSDVHHLGKLILNFNELKRRDDVPTKVLPNGSLSYQLVCKVTVTLSEQFFHALHFTAQWEPNLADDMEPVPGVGVERMDLGNETLLDIGAAFELSAL